MKFGGIFIYSVDAFNKVSYVMTHIELQLRMHEGFDTELKIRWSFNI